MSKYTTELRFICEQKTGYSESVGLSQSDTVIEKALDKVFNFDFPLFDETYRKTLETKIIKHYYFREIGFETVGLWQFYLNERLNLIMPYYNKLYTAFLKDIDPLSNYALKKTSNNKSDSKTDNKSSSESKNASRETSETIDNNTRTDNTHHKEVHESNDHFGHAEGQNSYDLTSDTPQGSINGLDSMNYISNAVKKTNTITYDNNEQIHHYDDSWNDGTVKVTDNSNSNSNNESTLSSTDNSSINVNSTSDYVELVTGYTGSTAISLIDEYVNKLKNIDEMVINELSDLFMNIY